MQDLTNFLSWYSNLATLHDVGAMGYGGSVIIGGMDLMMDVRVGGLDFTFFFWKALGRPSHVSTSHPFQLLEDASRTCRRDSILSVEGITPLPLFVPCLYPENDDLDPNIRSDRSLSAKKKLHPSSVSW
jgi:hypothetical protein